MNDQLGEDLEAVTEKVLAIFDSHDTRTTAAVMLGYSARAMRALIAGGIWSADNVKALLEETQRAVLTPQDEKPEIQYIMNGEPVGRPN
jgi:hypothetical protein